tara:strand:+ start:11202 stop:11351 length:150 start_codon:yes stop_codon:yes gene_type:complete
MAKKMNLIKNHKKIISLFKKQFGLNDYSLLWVSFIKGFLLAAILHFMFF